ISPAELARMCRQAGLDVADTKGMTYHVLSQTYALCDSTDVNYMFACRPAF
ncbi:TPA: bifunctional 3-demethylubiquinol 3-O-methyltransferase/2-polyprenyl-6-hydroxyphenol methylase, partial [Neisseria gonorrhoeae]